MNINGILDLRTLGQEVKKKRIGTHINIHSWLRGLMANSVRSFYTHYLEILVMYVMYA